MSTGRIAAWSKVVTSSVDGTAATLYENLDAVTLASELGEWLTGVLPETHEFSAYHMSATGALAALKRHLLASHTAICDCALLVGTVLQCCSVYGTRELRWSVCVLMCRWAEY